MLKSAPEGVEAKLIVLLLYKGAISYTRHCPARVSLLGLTAKIKV